MQRKSFWEEWYHVNGDDPFHSPSRAIINVFSRHEIGSWNNFFNDSYDDKDYGRLSFIENDKTRHIDIEKAKIDIDRFKQKVDEHTGDRYIKIPYITAFFLRNSIIEDHVKEQDDWNRDIKGSEWKGMNIKFPIFIGSHEKGEMFDHLTSSFKKIKEISYYYPFIDVTKPCTETENCCRATLDQVCICPDDSRTIRIDGSRVAEHIPACIKNYDNLTNLYINLSSDDFGYSFIERIENVDNENLKLIDLSENDISNIRNIGKKMKGLETLNITSNSIEKIRGLDYLENLKTLKLDFNPIVRIENMERLKNVEYISIKTNSLKSIDEKSVKKLSKLKEIHVTSNKTIKKMIGKVDLKDIPFFFDEML